MTEPRSVQIGTLNVSNAAPLTLIAGPCQLESRDHALMIAETLANACASAGCGLIFKSSYDKANRTSVSAQRGLGRDEGLALLACPTTAPSSPKPLTSFKFPPS
jgi:2-dehydro-3-deoxyphosphooctonate aldolase (KDO 8-P synthase)